jgi:hypothetical protein
VAAILDSISVDMFQKVQNEKCSHFESARRRDAGQGRRITQQMSRSCAPPNSAVSTEGGASCSIPKTCQIKDFHSDCSSGRVLFGFVALCIGW